MLIRQQPRPNALKKAGLNPGRGLRPKKGVYPSIIKNNPKGKVVLFYNTNTKNIISMENKISFKTEL